MFFINAPRFQFRWFCINHTEDKSRGGNKGGQTIFISN